jgi:hypothetical protein
LGFGPGLRLGLLRRVGLSLLCLLSWVLWAPEPLRVLRCLPGLLLRLGLRPLLCRARLGLLIGRGLLFLSGLLLHLRVLPLPVALRALVSLPLRS